MPETPDYGGQGPEAPTGEYKELFPEQEEEEESQAAELEDERLRPVASTMVAEWGYRRSDEMLIVLFQNGREAEYPCTPEQWEEAQKTDSAGRWLHANAL